jgi:DNA-binding transcriptional ArsR family regulator
MEPSSVFEMQAVLCRAMGNAIRLELVHILRDEPRNVSDLAGLTGHPQGTVSRHLATLKNAGVISGERRGQEIYYQIANPKISSVCDLMRQVLIEQAAHNTNILKEIQNETTE